MGFAGFILNNYVMLYELVGLSVLLMISAHLPEQAKKHTQIVVLLLLAESVFFTLERWTQSFTQLSVFRPILTACVYSIYPGVLFAMMRVTETTQRAGRKSLLIMLPWAVAVLLYFTSQWTHLVCWFSPDNHWNPGPLRYLPYVLFGFYSLVFLVQNIRLFYKYSRANRLTACYIVVGALLGVLIYKIYNENQDFSAIFSSAILLYYALFYTHMAKIDPLTSLLNRQSYYEDLKTDAQKITAAVSVDMNELKYFNDHFGHEAGDRALETVAEILRDNCDRDATIYRVGGDEFMILCRGLGEAEVKAMIERMREGFARTSYTCAFGYAMRKTGDLLEYVLVAADAKMYEDKAALKREIVAQGGTLHNRD